MTTIARLSLLSLLAACGGSEPAAPQDDAGGTPAAVEETPDLLRPVVEPLKMRKHIYRDLDVQKSQARDRETLFDRTVRER